MVYMNQSKMRKKSSYGSMDHLPKLYSDSKSTSRIMEEVWEFVASNASRRTSEIDIVNDFCLHFYEKIPHCFQKHSRNSSVPFTAFLVHYIDFLFCNFIRDYRRKQIDESARCEDYTFSEREGSILGIGNKIGLCWKNYSVDDTRFDREKYNIDNLPPKLCLIVKLYLGSNLQIQEMRQLVQETGCPNKASHFLKKRQKRQEMRETVVKNYKDKLNCLQALLYKAKNREELEKLLHKKNKIHVALARQNLNSEISRLAELFSVNKSTISRRLTIAIRYLHHIQCS